MYRPHQSHQKWRRYSSRVWIITLIQAGQVHSWVPDEICNSKTICTLIDTFSHDVKNTLNWRTKACSHPLFVCLLLLSFMSKVWPKPYMGLSNVGLHLIKKQCCMVFSNNSVRSWSALMSNPDKSHLMSCISDMFLIGRLLFQRRVVPRCGPYNIRFGNWLIFFGLFVIMGFVQKSVGIPICPCSFLELCSALIFNEECNVLPRKVSYVVYTLQESISHSTGTNNVGWIMVGCIDC